MKIELKEGDFPPGQECTVIIGQSEEGKSFIDRQLRQGRKWNPGQAEKAEKPHIPYYVLFQRKKRGY